MRKILKLMSALALGSFVTSPVLACANEDTDKVLHAISNGDSDYEGWNQKLDIGIIKPINPPIKDQKPKLTQTITKDKLTSSLAQNLAKIIMDKASITEPIVWFTSGLREDTICYNFTIDNGKLVETTGIRTWDVDGVTGRIAIDITYYVGVVNKDGTFKNKQQVKKTFNLKCDYTESDYKVYSVVESITNVPSNTINVKVDDKTKPNVGSVYTDFSTDTQNLMQVAISNALKSNPDINSVSIIVKGIDGKKVTSSLTLKINFIVSFQDSTIDMSLPSPYTTTSYPETTIQFSS